MPYRVDLEEERIEEREGNRGNAKAERDGRDDRERDERRPTERAHGEADIAGECFEEEDPALVAALVGGEGHGAEARECALARLRGTESTGHEFLRFARDVEGKFVVELTLDLTGLEQGAGPELQIVEKHDSGELHDAVDRG